MALLPALLLSALSLSAQSGERTLVLEDYLVQKHVSDVRVSSDGRSVAYVLREADLETNAWRSAIWLAPMDGSAQARRLTTGESDARSPRWSPDGRHLAFLASRSGTEGSQIWILPLAGGEASPATALRSGVSSFHWSPSGDRFMVIMQDTARARSPVLEDTKLEKEGPFVITELQFLRNGAGYLGYWNSRRRSRIYVVPFELAGGPVRSARPLTTGPYSSSDPAWSPDGRWIVFSSNRTPWPATNTDQDLWVVASSGGEPIRITDSDGSDHRPAWSPEGSRIAYSYKPPVQYDQDRVRTVTVEWREGRPLAGEPVAVADHLDRPAGAPQWSPDGSHLYFTLQDRGTQPLVRMRPGDQDAEPVLAGPSVVDDFSLAPDGRRAAVIVSWATRPPEVFSSPLTPVSAPVPVTDPDAHRVTRAADGGSPSLTNLSRANDEWLSEVGLVEPRPIRVTSSDGLPVEGWYMTPAEGSGPYPTILKIHGGPVSQYTWEYDFEMQWWAAQGYAVVYMNPRASSGYGEAFIHSGWKDWGRGDFEDVMAGVDRVVELGVADPDRLGVGGWSYGGVLTNYVIFRTDRFEAAISGAGESEYFSLYGTDDLQRLWERAGFTWENLDFYVEMSPVHHVEDVSTPTLFLVGAEDRRVPANQSEMYYIRLRRLEVPTGLIVYPHQAHGLGPLSMQVDRLKRYQQWYAKHMLGDPDADPFFDRMSW